MLEGKAVVGETDMLQAMMHVHDLRLAAEALDVFDVTDATEIARFIKKEFDSTNGQGWQCLVGTDFGSFVTHCYECFIYFCRGSLAVLLFKDAALGPEADGSKFSAFETMKARAPLVPLPLCFGVTGQIKRRDMCMLCRCSPSLLNKTWLPPRTLLLKQFCTFVPRNLWRSQYRKFTSVNTAV